VCCSSLIASWISQTTSSFSFSRSSVCCRSRIRSNCYDLPTKLINSTCKWTSFIDPIDLRMASTATLNAGYKTSFLSFASASSLSIYGVKGLSSWSLRLNTLTCLSRPSVARPVGSSKASSLSIWCSDYSLKLGPNRGCLDSRLLTESSIRCS
jgi:hypothetical protein